MRDWSDICSTGCVVCNHWRCVSGSIWVLT